MKTISRRLLAATAFAVAAWCGPVQAGDSNPLLDTRTLIGKLTPVTGEISYVNLHIPFKLNSADLTGEAETQLTYLGEALQSPELAGLEIGIFGHTDASGSAMYNMALSDQRAQTVRQFLLEKFDLQEARLTAKGYGEDRLLDSEHPNAAKNRRVEIVTTRPVDPDNTTVEGDTQAIN